MLNRFHTYASTHPAAQPFNGILAMQEHLDHRQQVESYVSGASRIAPHVPTNCEGQCTVAKWLHSENGACCKDLRLVDSLCQSCSEFREAASHIVWLASSGHRAMAKDALKVGGEYAEASEEFQESLVEFNLQYSGCPD